MKNARAWLAAAFGVFQISLLAQGTQTRALPQGATTPKSSFDVVSIKPFVRGGTRGGGVQGNRWVMGAATLRELLQTAYGQSGGPGQLQVVGAPDWAESERYDIQATMDCHGGVLSRNAIPLMVQSMLEDRFRLRAHVETRELPIYNLVVGKDGPKITASADQTPVQPPGGPPQPCGPPPTSVAAPPPPSPAATAGNVNSLPRGAVLTMPRPGSITIRASGVPLPTLIRTLQEQLGRPIVDKTNLTGLFDYTLQFSVEGGTSPLASDPVPSLFGAVQELGMRLESARGRVNVLVVDAAQKPSVN